MILLFLSNKILFNGFEYLILTAEKSLTVEFYIICFILSVVIVTTLWERGQNHFIQRPGWGGEANLPWRCLEWPLGLGKRTGQVELWDQPPPSFSENSALWSVSCAEFRSVERFSSSPCHSAFHQHHSVRSVSYPCWFLPWGFGWSYSLPGQPLSPSSIYISYLQGEKYHPLSKVLSKKLSCLLWTA